MSIYIRDVYQRCTSEIYMREIYIRMSTGGLTKRRRASEQGGETKGKRAGERDEGHASGGERASSKHCRLVTVGSKGTRGGGGLQERERERESVWKGGAMRGTERGRIRGGFDRDRQRGKGYRWD